MDRWEEDSKLGAVMKYIAYNPGKSLYDIGQNSGVNYTTAVRKIKNQYKLINDGIIRIELGKREAEKCWLTLKGLFFVIVAKFVHRNRGRDVRLRHKIEFAGFPMLAEMKDLTEEMEREFTGLFYRFTTISRADAPAELAEMLPSFAAMAVIGLLQKENHPYIKDHFRGRDLILSNGKVIENFEQMSGMLGMVAQAVPRNWIEELKNVHKD
jgi:hypothetical protein